MDTREPPKKRNKRSARFQTGLEMFPSTSLGTDRKTTPHGAPGEGVCVCMVVMTARQ